MSDNGASLWANAGCKMGPAGLEGDDDTWSAAPYNPPDPVTDTMMTVTTESDRSGGTSSTS